MAWELIWKRKVRGRMLNEIASLIAEERDGQIDVSILQGRREFTKIGPITGCQHFVSPLREVAIAPLRIRQMQYAEDSSGIRRIWRNLIGDVIAAGYNLLSAIQGQDDAQSWQLQSWLEVEKLLATPRGPLSFFDKETGFAWTSSSRDLTHTKVNLYFRFGSQSKIIAKRQVELASRSIDEVDYDIEGFSGEWEVDEIYAPLLSALQSFYEGWKTNQQSSHHHLYCWSDTPIDQFQPSFVRKLINWYLSDSRIDTNHSAYILLLFAVGGPVPKTSFDSFEKLAIQRMRPGGNMLVAPGFAKSTSEIPNRIAEIGLDYSVMDLVDEVPIHGCSVGMVEHTSVGILIPCWSGTWKESKEVDGEQVMTTYSV